MEKNQLVSFIRHVVYALAICIYLLIAEVYTKEMLKDSESILEEVKLSKNTDSSYLTINEPIIRFLYNCITGKAFGFFVFLFIAKHACPFKIVKMGVL